MNDTTNGPQPFDSAKLGGVLNRAVTESDNHRAEGLGVASALTAAHADALKLESSRVSGKYGAGSQQAADARTRLAAQNTIAKTATADSQRTAVGVPQVPANAAVVFGRVADPGGAGVARMTVAALDASGATLTYACSGANGEFSLTIPFAEPAPAGNPPAGTPAPEQQIVLQVTDPMQATRFRDAQPATVAAGTTTYRELPLGNPVPACTPPPAPPQASQPKPKPKRGDRDRDEDEEER